MVLKYHISPYPTLLENMIVKIYEASNDNPGAEVFTEVIPERDGGGVPTPGAGHQVPYTLTANGLDKVVHIVRLYSAVSANLLHVYTAEPKVDLVTVFDPIYFKIGDGGPNTPAATSNTYTNAVLAGLTANEYTVHRNNYGFLHEGIHRTNNPGPGGFVLTAPDEFGENEEFLIQMLPKMITTVVNDSVVGKWFAGFVDVAANTNYSNAHLRKLVRFAGTCSYTFQVADAIPIGYGFPFTHYGNPQGTGTVNFNNAPLKWGATTKNSIQLPSFTEALFVFDGNFWNVVYICDTRWQNAATQLPNTVMGAGLYNVGDVGPGDPIYIIQHNLNIAGDYLVLISIQSNSGGNYYKDNTIGIAWRHHATDKPNKFEVLLQELFGEVQNIKIAWTIIKL